MNLPPIQRLQSSDFHGQEGWIGRLLYPINQIFSALYSGLQNNITFQDNIASQIYTTTFNNVSNELSVASPLKFKWKYKTIPIGLLIVSLQDLTVPQTTFPLGYSPSWSYNSGSSQIEVQLISGLTANHHYSITFLAF
jgi:hypothetical protein